MRPAAGVYLHLPFCRSRCAYCAFVVSTDESARGAYLRALDAEMAILSGQAAGERFDSVYLGGGTPSLIPPADLDRLLDALKTRFAVDASSEVTLEANPDDVTPDLVRQWIAAGVTRVSVGVQSFEDEELAAVGRRHDAAAARQALQTLTGSGLSVSGDLLLGLPGQTAESFRRSLESLCEAGVEHVSVYLLETEKSKTIEEDRRLRPERYLSDDAQADLWLELGETLARRGFTHYEISNWALAGRQSRHNVKYWRRTPTLGLGVSAHELWGGRRRANVSALTQYIDTLGEGRRPLAFEREIDADEEARERILLGLRLSEGVPGGELADWIARSEDENLTRDYGAWRAEALLEEADGRVRLTEKGFLVSNEILCRFV